MSKQNLSKGGADTRRVASPSNPATGTRPPRPPKGGNSAVRGGARTRGFPVPIIDDNHVLGYEQHGSRAPGITLPPCEGKRAAVEAYNPEPRTKSGFEPPPG